MTFSEFNKAFPYMQNQEQMRDMLFKMPKPEKLCGVDVPDSLDGLTLGELLTLQSMEDGNVISVIADVILKKNDEALAKEDVNDVFGLLAFVTKELQRIGKMFEDIQIPHTSEEIAAGINDLQFGAFGLIDWYAKRMGITNHEDAEKTPWIRVYMCQKIDNQTAMFEKRLRDIMYKKHK